MKPSSIKELFYVGLSLLLSAFVSYGHLRLPVSIYMAEQGFKDSFREVNPDETSRSEGTWASDHAAVNTVFSY